MRRPATGADSLIFVETDARHRLKLGTDDLHRRVEASFDRADWLASSSSYGACLARWVGLLTVLEKGLAPCFGGDELAWHIGRRRHRLAEDLAHLACPASAESSSPDARFVPSFAGRAEAFGALYVLEGSGLGGRIIAKRVRDRLGPAVPTGFLDGDGAGTGSSWLAFVGRLDAALSDPNAVPGAVTGARDTFLLVEDWLGAPAPSAGIP